MTTRTDITYDFNDSPRIAEIASPSVGLVVQDWVDTTRPAEESFRGMSEFKMMDAGGKEDLGAGLFVGITVAQQNTQIAFQARTTPAEQGTVSTPSGAPALGRITFEDSVATFIANGVTRGALVINFTDQSVADVVSVNSEVSLTTTVLVNGLGNTFDISDVYHVFNIIQVRTTGGNLTAVDDLGAPISPILPTAFTQVIQETSTASSLINNDSKEAIATAVWAESTALHIDTSTFGGFVTKKLLTFAQWLSLKGN